VIRRERQRRQSEATDVHPSLSSSGPSLFDLWPLSTALDPISDLF